MPAMKFLLDENTEYRLLPYLQSLDHDVTAIAKDYPYGVSAGRIILTNDTEEPAYLQGFSPCR